MQRVLRQSVRLLFTGMTVLIIAPLSLFIVYQYSVKQLTLFDSLECLQQESLLRVKAKLENTKVKIDFTETIDNFYKYPSNRYYLQMMSMEGKNVAILVPKGFSKKEFAGLVINRNDNNHFNAILSAHETNHTNFQFEDNVILATMTPAMNVIYKCQYILNGIAIIIGIIAFNKIRKHYML